MRAISSLNTRLPRWVTLTPFTSLPGMAGRLMFKSVSFGKSFTATMRCSSSRNPSLCVPSIAVSYAGSDLDTLGTHKDGLRELLQRIVAVKDFPKETLLNINLPAIPGSDVKGVKVTHLGSRVFSEEIALMKDPWGKEIYWIGGGRITWSGDADSDFRATSDGYISVTPLHMDMTNYSLIEVVRQWFPGD